MCSFQHTMSFVRPSESASVEEYLAWTRHPNPLEVCGRHSTLLTPQRKLAAKSLCPCTVRAEVDAVWERLFEMTSDPVAIVRDQALHALGDGSPKHMEDRVVEVAERLYNDPDPSVKKKARRMLNAWRYTGKWNVL
jgi:hypothetical protein